MRGGRGVGRGGVAAARIHVPNRPDFDAIVSRESAGPAGTVYRATAQEFCEAYAALAPPRQQPDTPTNAHLLVYGGSSRRVLFTAPASNGGAEITRYRVEWDTSADFDSLDGGPLGSNTILVDPTSGAYDDCTMSYCGYTIGSLATGKNYTARVFAANAYGYSTSSSAPRAATRPTWAK